MQFIVLLYAGEDQDDVSEDVLIQQFMEYEQELEAAGIKAAGEALQPVSTATSVRVRDGKTNITDGPFAETKEQLGGYYLMECDHLDQAIEWAAKIPSARYGTVELRPIMTFDM